MKDELKKMFMDSSPDGTGTPYDSYRAIEELRHDAEKGLFMTEGAMNLLERQERDSENTRMCGVCCRTLPSRRILERCVQTLQAKRQSVARLRHAEALVIHDSCVAAMNEVCSKPDKQLIASQHRLAYYLRDGELSEWRQQKVECMVSMCCFACAQKFTSSEFSGFLKRVDQKAAAMERELHVHPKFVATSKSSPATHESTGGKALDDKSKRCRMSESEEKEEDEEEPEVAAEKGKRELAI